MARNTIGIIIGLLLTGQLAIAQSDLHKYIELGLESNLALQQRLTSYQQSLEALREARGMFFPTVSVNARYTVAQGGRVIEFPVGDLLNAPYSTLNALSAIHGLTDPATGQPIYFPELENQEFSFYRPREHETRLELVQPIFSPQIYYNHKAKQNLAQVKKADADAYRRHLVAEIKTAYYSYLKALGVLRLVENTRILLDENIRVNERLYSNDMVTIDNMYRSQAELAKLNQQHAEAVRMEQMATAYLNFLVNLPVDTPISIDEMESIPEPRSASPNAANDAIGSREELKMLEGYSLAASNMYNATKSNRLPSIMGVVNYGFQGEKYRFTGEYDYMLASVVLRWDLFAGRQNDARIQQAKLEQLKLEQKTQEVEEAIKLEVINAWYSLKAAEQSILAAEAQADASRRAFEVVNRKHQEGEAPLIEYIDARSAMTNAEENLIIARYDYMIRHAEYELAAGLFTY